MIASIKALPKILLLFTAIILVGCKQKYTPSPNAAVKIINNNGQYQIIRNGEPFIIKGVAGYTNLKKLAEAGGNTIRTWDTTNLEAILKQADTLHLAVIAGLPMADNDFLDKFYKNPAYVSAQFKAYKALVSKYKKHPSLLFWCLGNELPFPYKPNYNIFYKTFNNIVDMIHQDDSDHPVTTTMINFQKKNIFNIKLRTNIDFISFNTFGEIRTLSKDLKDFEWYWDGPFMITEWGIDGPWADHPQTTWGAYIEDSSTKKAEKYLSIYKKYMPVDNPRFLGSLVFYWGHKQEATPTWFSLFDDTGAASEAVNAMSYIWTNRRPAHKAPQVKFMLLDYRGSKDTLLFKPGQMLDATVYLNGTDTLNLTYKWQVNKEDWYRAGKRSSDKKLKPLDSLAVFQKDRKFFFKAPQKEGPYRVYVRVYDKYGNYANCNTPFYVIDAK
jgi:hypothetical protein